MNRWKIIWKYFVQALIGAKLSRISFGKVNGFIRVYDRNRYLLLLGPKKFDTIHNKFRYLITQKSNILYIMYHNYAKTLTLQGVIIVTKSVFNKNQNHYYYNIFLEKCSFK